MQAKAGWGEIRPALPADLEAMHRIDEDALALYAEHGVHIELAPDHPFARAELARWQRSTERGWAFMALFPSGEPVGFAVLDYVDGQPYLDELAVRCTAMRRGVGSALLERAGAWARERGGDSLWLTTYGHLPFNRPYYEQRGFVVVPEAEIGGGIAHHLEQQRLYLPAPAERVAMRQRV